MKNLLLPIFLAGLAALPLSAALEWEATTLSFEAEPGQQKVEAAFPFTNTGETPVTITHTKASCGCTVPTLKKDTYAPGESGELEVVFTIGNRVGQQTKSIAVTTDDAPLQPARLLLKVDIPQIVKVEPYYLFWQAGMEPEPKSLQVTLYDGLPVEIADIDLIAPYTMEGGEKEKSSFTDNFEWELQEDPATPGRYTLTVQPKSTGVRGSARVVIRTNYPEEEPREATGFLYIR